MERDGGRGEENQPVIPPGIKELSQEELSREEISQDLFDEDTCRRNASLPVRILAGLILLAFIFLALGNVMPLLSWPSLGFLQESRDLNNDPGFRALQQAVVQVLNISREGSVFPVAGRKGTGFNIDPRGIIVTNKHLVEDADAISISFEDGGTYRAERWAWSTSLDLALVYLNLDENPKKLDSESLPVVELQFERFPKVGDEILVMGNPLGFRRVISKGSVSGYYPETLHPYPILEIEAPIYPGSSGSPVFDDENKVVAVVYASLEQDQKESKKGLAIPVFYLLEMEEERDGDSDRDALRDALAN